jgi:hypothetical protein
MFSVSSPNSPTRVISPSAHQQRDGALFNAVVDNTHAHQKEMIKSITSVISSLSPEIIPTNDQTGFFKNVNNSPRGVSYAFENVYSVGFGNPTQQGVLIAVGEHLPIVRAMKELQRYKQFFRDPELKTKLDLLDPEMRNDLVNQVPNFKIENKKDVLELIQNVVLSLSEPWSQENIAKVQTKINDFFPFLEN